MDEKNADKMEPREILDCCMKKLPSNRLKARIQYRVKFIISTDGTQRIDYHPRSRENKIKSIYLENLLFSDKKHDIDVKNTFSIYTIDKTITFVAQNEATRDEWLQKLREHQSNLYSEIKQYDAIFEANLLPTGLAKTMRINGPYRIALCKESLDLVPYCQPNKTNNQSGDGGAGSEQSTNGTGQDHGEAKEISQRKPLSHRRHPYLSSKTIELSLRTIRRVGHSGNRFFLESGRQSQTGEGDLWMTVNKNSTARLLHELLLAAMRLASTVEDHFLTRPPRSRSGSSTNANHTPTSLTNAANNPPAGSHPLGSSSSPAPVEVAAADSTTTTTTAPSTMATTLNTNNNNNNNNNTSSSSPTSSLSSITTSTTKLHLTNNNIDEDSAYTPMA